MRDRALITGKVTVEVFDADGNLKRFPQTWWQKFLHLAGSPMRVVNHNIVTDEGDALIADILAQTPARQKFDNTNAFIQVGTGWTGTTPKANATCNTATGSPEPMDTSYPQLKGSWGNTDDSVIVYKATFEAGDLNATSPAIDECAILNNVTPASADCLAYAQISPEIPVSSSDTLAITWEITFLGA